MCAQFKCCGFKNYTDFDGSPFYNEHGGNVYPETCCNATITEGVCNKNEAHLSVQLHFGLNSHMLAIKPLIMMKCNSHSFSLLKPAASPPDDWWLLEQAPAADRGQRCDHCGCGSRNCCSWGTENDVKHHFNYSRFKLIKHDHNLCNFIFEFEFYNCRAK